MIVLAGVALGALGFAAVGVVKVTVAVTLLPLRMVAAMLPVRRR